MAIVLKKTPAWTPGQGMSLSGTGPGMVVQSPGGGGGGGARPLVDGNHIHVWNCNDQVGSSVLVDSVGGKDLTLQGSAGTNYSLGQLVGGSPYPYARGLLDGTSTPLAISTDFSMSVSQVTYECVVRFSAVPTSTSRSLMTLETVGGGPLDYVYMEYIQYESYGSKIYGAVYNDGPYPSGNFTTTTITNYDAPDISISADTTYYVMWTYDSSNGEQKMYIDGVLKNTTSGISPTLTNLTKFTLGSASGNRSFQGYIRDVRISNIVRDASYAAAAAAALTT